MQIGDSVEGYFHGRGTYCNRIALRNYGHYHTKVVKQGSMILPEGDTLRNVLLVHTERIEGEQYHPDIYHDSLCVYTIDSVMTRLQTDSTLATIHIDRWYAPGYRYPILKKRQECEDSTENSAEESQIGHAGEHYEMQVYCSGLSAGNYVLHLQVGGKTVFSSPCNL
jgi:hypothetical protein